MPNERIKALIQKEVEELEMAASQYSGAIDVRRRTIQRSASDLAGVKMVIKSFDKGGLSKRHINGIYANMVEEHNQHLAVLLRLKGLLTEVRETQFLKGALLKTLE